MIFQYTRRRETFDLLYTYREKGGKMPLVTDDLAVNLLVDELQERKKKGAQQYGGGRVLHMYGLRGWRGAARACRCVAVVSNCCTAYMQKVLSTGCRVR